MRSDVRSHSCSALNSAGWLTWIYEWKGRHTLPGSVYLLTNAGGALSGDCGGLGFDDGLNPRIICQQLKDGSAVLGIKSHNPSNAPFLKAMLRHKSSLREGRIHVCSRTPFHLGHRNASFATATYPRIRFLCPYRLFLLFSRLAHVASTLQ